MKSLSPLFLVLVILFTSCSKSDTVGEVSGNVDIYLVKSFNERSDSDAIDIANIVLEDDPFISYSDIESYERATRTFKIADDKKSLFAIDGNTMHFKAFAVKANNEIIYTGFFWPSYSSQSINWVVIDPLMANIKGELEVRLGYPGMVSGSIIPDDRNDSRIINILKRDNKLVD